MFQWLKNRRVRQENTELPTPETSVESEISKRKSRKYSLGSVKCRICFDAEKEETSISPCYCKGSIANVHLSCLEAWLAASNTQVCELCGFQFMVKRSLRYGIWESIYIWLFFEPEYLLRGHARFDLVAVSLMTPLVFASIYCCIALASAVGMHRDKDKGTNKDDTAISDWANTAMSLLAVLIAFAYYIWMTGILRTHFRMWYRYWQARSLVKLLNTTPPKSILSKMHEVAQPSTSRVVHSTSNAFNVRSTDSVFIVPPVPPPSTSNQVSTNEVPGSTTQALILTNSSLLNSTGQSFSGKINPAAAPEFILNKMSPSLAQGFRFNSKNLQTDSMGNQQRSNQVFENQTFADERTIIPKSNHSANLTKTPSLPFLTAENTITTKQLTQKTSSFIQIKIQNILTPPDVILRRKVMLSYETSFL